MSFEGGVIGGSGGGGSVSFTGGRLTSAGVCGRGMIRRGLNNS